MVTGDNIITANAIAKECKIIEEDKVMHGKKEYVIMEGPEFFKLVGGLICITCGNKSPCDCKPSKVNEKVVNSKVFAEIRESLCVLA